jgi:putative membrane protein
MVALFALVTLALHLPVANPAGPYRLHGLRGDDFAAIVLALNVLLGSVGQFSPWSSWWCNW